MSFVFSWRHIKSLLLSGGRNHQFTNTLARTLSTAATLHPDLYRVGSATSPEFDQVRIMDIPVVGGMVIPGVSSLGSGLRAVNDHGSHWLIRPEMPMSLQAFVGKLQELNSQAVKDTGPCESSEELRFRIQPDFAIESDLDKAGRFVYHALATVVHQRLEIKNWDDNDYAYIAVLARGLRRGDLALSSLRWDADSGQHWTKEMAMAAQAVQVYMDYDLSQAEGNEDDEADAHNDIAMLTAVLHLDSPRNVLSALSSCG
ncbi:hypothetical protein EXIGLDRAFT_681294 [Exidia glandulosa HHB12029]|uniref:Uncharacterized protein n=1 Tax=Exidia glandulosa HHB12029 TaxID=1314781 RepID=A0A165E4X2_EXIGL|nr:hypothetical protein EXIGLDRAFT_681294 [Exidia glandulosa HHB12029]